MNLTVKIRTLVPAKEVVGEFIDWIENEQVDMNELNELFSEWFSSNYSRFIEVKLVDTKVNK